MIRHTFRLVLIATGLALADTVALHAAAPSILLVDRPGQQRPIVIAGYEENAKLMHAIVDVTQVPTDALTGRSYVVVAMFWGPDWHQYLVDGKPLDALKLSDGNQHARFYPASQAAPALFVFELTGPFANTAQRVGRTRLVHESGLEMLKKHGVVLTPR